MSTYGSLPLYELAFFCSFTHCVVRAFALAFALTFSLPVVPAITVQPIPSQLAELEGHLQTQQALMDQLEASADQLSSRRSCSTSKRWLISCTRSCSRRTWCCSGRTLSSSGKTRCCSRLKPHCRSSLCLTRVFKISTISTPDAVSLKIRCRLCCLPRRQAQARP